MKWVGLVIGCVLVGIVVIVGVIFVVWILYDFNFVVLVEWLMGFNG